MLLYGVNPLRIFIYNEGLVRFATEKYDKPTEEQIREGISGNLCRCTGYVKIVDAIQTLAEGK